MAVSALGFPNLHAGNHRDVSPPTRGYNCIAWAAGFDDEWWDPFTSPNPDRSYYWPANVPRGDKVTSLIMAFATEGFAICGDGSQEDGSEKIALYADGEFYLHAARQLANGKWTSKIGELEDIEHDAPGNLEGPWYGHVTTFMKRNRTIGPSSAKFPDAPSPSAL